MGRLTPIAPPGLGSGECYVVVAGHVYRCIMTRAAITAEIAEDGGFPRRSMECSYVIVDDAEIDARQQRAITHAVETVTSGKRLITFDE